MMPSPDADRLVYTDEQQQALDELLAQLNAQGRVYTLAERLEQLTDKLREGAPGMEDLDEIARRPRPE